MIPTCEFSEHKERDVVLVLHHCHAGVMNARSCAKRRNAQFFSGASFSHGVFNGDWRRRCIQSRLRMRSACHAELRNGARLRVRLAFFLGKAKRFVCEWNICRCNAPGTLPVMLRARGETRVCRVAVPSDLIAPSRRREKVRKSPCSE